MLKSSAQVFKTKSDASNQASFSLIRLFFVLVVCTNIIAILDGFRALDIGLYDRFIQLMQSPTPEDVVIVEIDEASLTLLGDWPWDRSFHAEMISALQQSNVNAIAYNVVFANADAENLGDQMLRNALQQSDKVILPIYIDRITQEGQLLEILPAPMFSEHASLGHVNMHLDEDGVARSVFLREGLNSDYWSHFSLVAAQLSASLPVETALSSAQEPQKQKLINQYVRRHHYFYPYVGDVGRFYRASFADVIMGKISMELFSNKTVFIGVTATSIGDPLSTPSTQSGIQMPAVEINANIYQAIRQGQLIQTAPNWLLISINSLMLLLALWLMPKLPAYWQLLLTMALSGFVLYFSWILLTQFLIWFKSAALIVSLLLTPLLWNALRLNRLYRYLRAELNAFRQQANVHHFTSLKIEQDMPDGFPVDSATKPVENELTQSKSVCTEHQITDLIRRLKPDAFLLQGNDALLAESNADLINVREHQIYKAWTSTFVENHTRLELKIVLSSGDQGAHQKKLLDDVFWQLNQFQSLNQISRTDIFFQQIDIIRQYQQQMQQAQQMFDACIQLLSGGILVADVFGRVLFQNQQAEKLLGLTESNKWAFGWKDQVRLKEGTLDWNQLLQKIFQSTERIHFEGETNSHYLSLSIQRVCVGEPAVHLILLHIADVTQMHDAQLARNEMIDFLSHDMRSPMTSIKAMLNQRRETDSQEMNESANLDWLNQVEEKVEKSLHYTEQLLHLAKVESDQPLQKYEVDLYSVAQNAVDSLFYVARQKNIEIKAHIDDDCWVWGNGDLLERVLINLLSNAIKYGDQQSPVELNVHKQISQNAIEGIRVSVKNCGKPISETLKVSLFKPFHRGQDEKQKGIGLGLRFVDATLKKHQSQIQLTSNPSGTEFFFVLNSMNLETVE